MAEITHPIPVIAEAYRLVQCDPDIEILEPLRDVAGGEAGAAEFRCRLPVRPHPNPAGLPCHANVRVHLAATFPLSAVSVYLEGREFQGFPHQDAETGKLCLYEEHRAPWDDRRLAVFLNWAKEWLTDAAMDQLLRHGDPFELPDFSRHKLPNPLPTYLPILFDENAETFARWNGKVGRSGRVELAVGDSVRGLLTRTFQDAGGIVSERFYADGVCEPGQRIFGRWILLPDLRFFRHRPPQTYGELRQICKSSAVALDCELHNAWDESNERLLASVVLVGCPIPKRVGETPVEIHWQPLLFEAPRTDRADRRFKPKHGSMTDRALWNVILQSNRFAADAPLPWGKSTNISRERLYARGHVSRTVSSRCIAVVGCGATGSVAAELLARGGSRSLSLFDSDYFEIGNQCRHTLDGTHLAKNKAEALATRLLSCNPLSAIHGFAAHLPLFASVRNDIKGAREALVGSDLLLDCSADEAAFLYLNSIARETRASVASMFFNFSAEIMTLCVSGRHTSCKKVCRRLYRSIRNGETPVSPATYFREPEKGELIVPGAGCWHPTFPAVNTHVWMLTSSAIEMLCNILARPLRTDGTAVLIRRNPIGVGPLMEIVWERTYR